MPLCPSHNVIIGPDRWCALCNEHKAKEPTSAEASRLKRKADQRHLIIFLIVAQLVGFAMIKYGF